MHLPGLFLLWLIPFVHADKDILVEEPRSGGRLWYWSIFKIPSQGGAGWSHPSSQSRRYSVCDDDSTNEPNNWLRTEFIDVKNAKRLDIEVTYRFLNCPEDVKPHCKTNFTIYAYHTDKKDPAPDPLYGIFQKELFISPETLPPVGQRLTVTSHGSVVTKAKGIYLAFLDQGACLTMNKVIISYRYCPERGKFPTTVAPINNVNLTKQVAWPEISDMKTARARISRPIWPRNIQRVCMTSIRQNEIEGVVAHLEHLPRSL